MEFPVVPDQRVTADMTVRSFPGAGSPVVWIHGLGESGRCFDPIVRHPRLRDGAHVVPDLPGYGRSPWGPPRALDETVDGLAAWLATVGPAVLVGHSLGGVLATLVAERAPAHVRAVVDVDGNTSLGDCTFSSKIAAWGERAFVDAGHAALVAELAAGHADPAVRGYAASMAFAEPRQLWRHAVDLVELSASETLAGRRAALAVPLTFIAGAPRGVCARSRELLDAAGVRVIDVAPAGHWPFIDQPDAFAAAVAAAMTGAGS
ncbi:MAG: alpha/beta fold hydrolase [Kofleriaceae bacterium]